MDKTPTEKDFRDFMSLIDAEELQSSKIVMSQSDFELLLGPIVKAARELLHRLYPRHIPTMAELELLVAFPDTYKKRGSFMSDNNTDHETKIGEILMKISEHPDDELSEQQATMLCQGIAKHLDDPEADIVDAAYALISQFLSKASKETRDSLTPALVVHDL